MSKFDVQVCDLESGKLLLEDDEYIFYYTNQDSKRFVSLTMPVRKKGYVHSRLHPIFEMHLPEGYLLSIIKKHFSKLQKMDDFGLLGVISASIKGRVTYDSFNSSKEDFVSLDTLLHPKSSKLFDELVSKFALQSALSGVQPKVLAKVEDKATLRLDQYIIKSWGEDYPQLALNEYYCMEVARLAGVSVPHYFISDDDKLFILKRFDIADDGTSIGFEDMSVLQAKSRDDKYSGSYEQIVKTIKTFVSPKYKNEALINFYKMIVINYLVQNGDAHLKNFGLLYHDIDDIWLAPVYDVVCTTAYIQNDIPALHLMGSKKWLNRKILIRFGIESCELTPKEAKKYFVECLDARSDVLDIMIKRLKYEKDKEKIEILEYLVSLFSNDKDIF